MFRLAPNKKREKGIRKGNVHSITRIEKYNSGGGVSEGKVWGQKVDFLQYRREIKTF